MVSGWQSVADPRPLQKTFPLQKREARCVYVLCLAAGVLSVVIFAYVTSFKLESVQFPKRLWLDNRHAQPTENVSDESTIQIVGFVNKNGEQIGLDSLMGYPRKGVLELRWKKNGSDPQRVTPKPATSGSGAVPKMNCSGVNRTSEILSMVPFKYLVNYKNPCWYEPLTKVNVYETNRFYHFSKHSRNLFDELEEEWQKRLETNPEPKRLRCLPYFFIAGQPKCGSTDLYVKLTSHPDVVSPPMKEPHWWAKNRFGWRLNYTSSVSLHDYTDLFDKAALYMEHVSDPNSSEEEEAYHQLITGDASVSTLWYNDNWWRLPENCGLTEPKYTNAHYIRYHLPHARIIVILRDPIERLYSDYLYFQKSRKSADNFHHEVTLAISAHEMCTNVSTLRACIYNHTVANSARVRLRVGMYYAYLQEWYRVFPRDQIMVLRLEDYAVHAKDTLKSVFKFLGLRTLAADEEDSIFQKPRVNARRNKDRELGDIRSDTRAILEKFYKPFNHRLSILLHDTKYLWSTSP